MNNIIWTPTAWKEYSDEKNIIRIAILCNAYRFLRMRNYKNTKVISIDMILTSQSVSLFFLVRLTLSENYTIYYVAKIVWIFAVPASNRI